MGVNLSRILSPKKINFRFLSNKIIVFDGYNMLYQFLALIRTPSGELLRDSSLRVTSHINGLVFRLTKLLEFNIRPIIVFDGKPPEEKAETLMRRVKQRKKAFKEWRKALSSGDYGKAWSKAVQTSSLTKEMVKETKTLLDYMGIPWIQAPSEGEAQAAYMVSQGDAWAVGSRDYDSLLFGGLRLVRYITLTGKKFRRKEGKWYRLKPELFDLNEILSSLSLSREQLIELGILVGTDYNEGVKGIGPAKALKLIKTYGSLEELIRRGKVKIGFDYEKIKEIYVNPDVTKNYKVTWGKPRYEKIAEFLCDERNFNPGRVKKVIDRLKKFNSRRHFKLIDKWLNHR